MDKRIEILKEKLFDNYKEVVVLIFYIFDVFDKLIIEYCRYVDILVVVKIKLNLDEEKVFFDIIY